MSPEYKRWKDVPKDFKVEMREEIHSRGIDINRLIHTGFAVFIKDETIDKVRAFEDLTPGIIQNAKKKSGDWHLVRGIDGSGHHKKAPIPPIGRKELELKGHTNPYRGKHRSTNKGLGLDAFLSKSPASRNRRRR